MSESDISEALRNAANDKELKPQLASEAASSSQPPATSSVKNSITTMEEYLNHYGMEIDPFAERVNDGLFYPGGEFQAILDQLLHLSRYSASVLLITGPRGSGKSSLKRMYVDSIEQSDTCVCVIESSLSMASDQLLVGMCQGLGLKLAFDGDIENKLFDRVISYSQMEAGNHRSILFVIDDAQDLGDDALKTLLRLTQICREQETDAVHIALFGDDSLANRMAAAQWDDVLIHHVQLKSLPFSEIQAYLSYRLETAGFTGDFPFSRVQLEKIYLSSRGNPRLLLGAARQAIADSIDEGIKVKKRLPTLHIVSACLLGGILAVLMLIQQNELPGLADADRSADLASTTSEGGVVLKPLIELPGTTNDSTVAIDAELVSESGVNEEREIVAPEVKKDKPIAIKSLDEALDQALEKALVMNNKEQRPSTPDVSTSNAQETIKSVGAVKADEKAVSTVSDTSEVSAVVKEPAAVRSDIVANVAVNTSKAEESKARKVSEISDSESRAVADILNKLSPTAAAPKGMAKASTAEKATPTKAKEAVSSTLIAAVSPTTLGKPVAATKQKPVANVLDEVLGKTSQAGGIYPGEKRLLDAKGSGYTIQLFGSHSEKRVKQFIDSLVKKGALPKNQRQSGSRGLSYFRTYHNDKDWYVVVYDNYANRQDAKKVVATMPSALKKLKPWIRSIGGVQKNIKQYHKL